MNRKEEQQDFSDWAFIHSHFPENAPNELSFDNGAKCFEFYYQRSPSSYPENIEKHINNYTAYLKIKDKL